MLIQSMLLAGLAALGTASPLDAHLAERDLRSCNNNVALSALKVLKASAFCSEFLNLKTQTSTVRTTFLSTVPASTTISTTSTILFTTTTQTIRTVPETVTATETGPTSTVLTTTTTFTTPLTTVTSTSTTTSTSTSTVYVRDMRKRAMIEAREPVPRAEEELNVRYAIPPALKSFASSVISTACNCFVTAGTTTTTTTQTSLTTSTATSIASFTTSVAIATSTITSLTTATQTTTLTLAGSTGTSTIIITTAAPTVTITASTATTVQTTTTITKPNQFINKFKGNGCVYNRYTNYDLINEPYSTDERMFQVCAARCDLVACKFFFAYQDNEYPYQWCIIDNQYYDPSYLQCNIPFSGRNLGYNSPY